VGGRERERERKKEKEREREKRELPGRSVKGVSLGYVGRIKT